MSTIADVEELALGLPVSERGKLANKLIASLPSPLVDDDENWVEEAFRRDREMDEKPETVLTEEQFFRSLREHVRK